jgi:hypothetical protein
VLTAQITQITYIPIAPRSRRPDRRDLQPEHRQLRGLDPVVDPAGGGRGLHPRPDHRNWIGVGGSASAARNLGVPVNRVKVTLFAGTAFSAAILAAVQV